MAILPGRLHHGLESIASTFPRRIAAGVPGRRASVAIIIRIKPTEPVTISSPQSIAETTTTPETEEASTSIPASPLSESLSAFFSQPWVQSGVPEILYIKRASRATDRWSSHIAFPGGREEPDDEGSLYTAMRETWEEVGIDLAEPEYINIGQLDDREITTSLGKRLLMILSPHVFLCTSPECPIPDLQPSEVASAHWIPLDLLVAPKVRWGDVTIDLGKRLAPKSPLARWLLSALIGAMHFQCILLPNHPATVNDSSFIPELRLWGLTLGMSLDLLSYISQDPLAPTNVPSPAYPFLSHSDSYASSALGSSDLDPIYASFPGIASILPRFAHPDMSFWLWVFGFRYRRLLKHWAQDTKTQSRQDTIDYVRQDRHVNWPGLALGHYYSSLRRALVLAVTIRAIIATSTIVGGIYWIHSFIKRRRNRLV